MELKALAQGQTLFFQVWRRVGRTDRMTDTCPRITEVFFYSYELPKTLPATMLLLFGHVMSASAVPLILPLEEH